MEQKIAKNVCLSLAKNGIGRNENVPRDKNY